MRIDTVCQTLIDEFRSRPTIRAGSLITTVFGDSIAPRGGTLWLGSLISLMADFGVSERLVRTSVFRLASDGWLESEQCGRKAYYSLTADGRERFRAATNKIYGAPAEAWDGNWSILLLSNLNAVTRDLVRKECGWLGFGSFSTSVMAHPKANAEDLNDTLKRLKVADLVVIMNASTLDSDIAMRMIANESWNLNDIDARYEKFVSQFRRALTAASKGNSMAPKTAFLIRTLLIQDYRTVLLRDPQMPTELVPNDWHGLAAYNLCRNLYGLIYERADEHLTKTIETKDGVLPAPGDAYYQRFGGLRSNK